MTKYRLVRKRKSGYEPYYEIQTRVLGLFWVVSGWSTSLETAQDFYMRKIENSKYSDEFFVLDER